MELTPEHQTVLGDENKTLLSCDYHKTAGGDRKPRGQCRPISTYVIGKTENHYPAMMSSIRENFCNVFMVEEISEGKLKIPSQKDEARLIIFFSIEDRPLIEKFINFNVDFDSDCIVMFDADGTMRQFFGNRVNYYTLNNFHRFVTDDKYNRFQTCSAFRNSYADYCMSHNNNTAFYVYGGPNEEAAREFIQFTSKKVQICSDIANIGKVRDSIQNGKHIFFPHKRTDKKNVRCEEGQVCLRVLKSDNVNKVSTKPGSSTYTIETTSLGNLGLFLVTCHEGFAA